MDELFLLSGHVGTAENIIANRFRPLFGFGVTIDQFALKYVGEDRRHLRHGQLIGGH